MSYSSLLVHVRPDGTSKGCLSIARELADRFHSVVIGAAACDPLQPASFEAVYGREVIEKERGYGKEWLDAAEAIFRTSFSGLEDRIEWRSAFAVPGPFVARLSRAADLVIAGTTATDVLADPNWQLDPGDLVLQAGRPVLVVPENYARRLRAKTIVVGWKNSRESRRAVADALLLTLLAQRVVVASIAESDRANDDGVADVVGWFQRLGVAAEGRRDPLVSDPASQLRTLALDEDADLIVAGAYGHSRAREWVLGGVSFNLLTKGTAQCLLMSH
jgi:nucleotide-binding universal stress UspA family protein